EEEADHASDLVRPTQSLDWYLLDNAVEDRLGDLGHHLSCDESRSHAIDGDPFAGRFQREALGESVERCLRGSVIGLSDVPGLADDRAQVDNAPTAPLEHVV